jgi:hypothetical protein
MKTILIKTILLPAIVGISLASCTAEEPGEFNVEHISGEGWTVASFTDGDDLYTSRFIGHVFTFQDNGSFLATVNDTSTFQGFYEITGENTRILFDIDGTNGLEKLRENWQIMATTPNSIELREVGDDDKVKFVK